VLASFFVFLSFLLSLVVYVSADSLAATPVLVEYQSSFVQGLFEEIYNGDRLVFICFGMCCLLAVIFSSDAVWLATDASFNKIWGLFGSSGCVLHQQLHGRTWGRLPLKGSGDVPHAASWSSEGMDEKIGSVTRDDFSLALNLSNFGGFVACASVLSFYIIAFLIGLRFP
jgi:hypothetical protein